MAKLTDIEQQEIVRFLEAGQPLPDKYRFLLFEDKREVELVWNGKTSEVSNIVLPFQIIEQVDEPRAEQDTRLQPNLFDVDARGRQLKGWTNKLIWGDNKLILSSLKNGPLREEIEKQGGLKLIYIDPPFDVGADFSMDIEIGDDTFTKKPNILEEIAYRDTWGKGADSFIAMIYERLALMRDLLALGLWTPSLKNQLVAAEGSVQSLDIPAPLKAVYKTAYELSMKTLIDMAADRGAYVDQSMSLNMFVAEPTFRKLSSMHFYAWRKGLKTGMYYLRSKAASGATKITVVDEPAACDACSG